MEGLGRGVVIMVAVVGGYFVGGQVECLFVPERDRSGCIPIIGSSVGAIGAGVGTARLTHPRHRKAFQDPDLEEQIRERRRRWTGNDD